MRIKINLIHCIALSIIFTLVSCGASVDGDAKKAAELTRKSLEYTVKRDLDKAEQAFEQSKLIKDKYKESPDEFYELYTKYLDI